MNEKGITPILLLMVIIAVATISGYVLYSGRNNSNQKQINQNPSITQSEFQPSSSPSPIIYYSKDPNSNSLTIVPNPPQPIFAIYPGAELDKVVYFSEDSYVYIYHSSDPFSKVVKWYDPVNFTTGEPNPEAGGWVLAGGAGSFGEDRFGYLRKGDIRYKITITNFRSKSYTEIRVVVPKN